MQLRDGRCSDDDRCPSVHGVHQPPNRIRRSASRRRLRQRHALRVRDAATLLEGAHHLADDLVEEQRGRLRVQGRPEGEFYPEAEPAGLGRRARRKSPLVAQVVEQLCVLGDGLHAKGAEAWESTALSRSRPAASRTVNTANSHRAPSSSKSHLYSLLWLQINLRQVPLGEKLEPDCELGLHIVALQSAKCQAEPRSGKHKPASCCRVCAAEAPETAGAETIAASSDCAHLLFKDDRVDAPRYEVLVGRHI